MILRTLRNDEVGDVNGKPTLRAALKGARPWHCDDMLKQHYDNEEYSKKICCDGNHRGTIDGLIYWCTWMQ